VKNTLLFSALASLSVALVACPGPVAVPIASVSTPSGTYTAAAGSNLVVPVVVTRTAGNTTAPLTFTCQLSGGALTTAITGTATTPSTSGGTGGSCTYALPATLAAGTYTHTATSTAAGATNVRGTASVTVTAPSTATGAKIDAGKSANPPAGWTADSGSMFLCYATDVSTGAGTAATQFGNTMTTTTANPAPAGGNTNYGPSTGTTSIYADERFCPSATLANLRFAVPVTSGATKVRLHFVEAYRGTGGSAPATARQMTLQVTNGSNTLAAPVTITLPLATATTSAAYVYDVNIPGTVTTAGNVTVSLTSNGNGDPTIAGVEVL